MRNPERMTRKLSLSPKSQHSGKASTRWHAPVVNYPKQKRFCQTKEDFHREYGLSLEGEDPRCLSDDDVPEDQWVTVFTHKHVNNEKIHLKSVRLEFYEECALLYHMIYQRIPPNNEVTVKFARGFVFEKCRSAQNLTKKAKHKVAWAVFAESVIANVTLKKNLQTKMDLWRAKNCPSDASAISALHTKEDRLDTSLKAGPSQSGCLGRLYDTAYSLQPAFLVHTALAVDMVSAANKKLQEKESSVVNCRCSIDEAKTKRDKAKGVRDAVEALLRRINKTNDELKVLEGDGDEASIWKLRAEIMGCQVALDLLGPDVCSSTLEKAVDELQDLHNHLMKEVEEAKVQFCFVKDLVNRVERRQVPTVALAPPKAHCSAEGTLTIQNECVACGLSIEDSEVVSVYMLPCRHPYHPICFATLCYTREECVQIGCNQSISHSTRETLFGWHENLREQSILRVEAAGKTEVETHQAKAPLSRKHSCKTSSPCKPVLQPEPLTIGPFAMDGASLITSNGDKGGGNALHPHDSVAGAEELKRKNKNVDVQLKRRNCVKSPPVLPCSAKECCLAELSVAEEAMVETSGKKNMLQHGNASVATSPNMLQHVDASVAASPDKDHDTFQHMTLNQIATMGTKKRKGAQREKAFKRQRNAVVSANTVT